MPTSYSRASNITINDVIPHLQQTLFITGAFCVAWSWDLIVYSVSHIYWGENPLSNQLAFADQPGSKNFMVLLSEYLTTCGAAAALSIYVQKLDKYWSPAAIVAIEFFPSPVFAGKLMSFLSQFDLTGIQQALLNLAATWFAAFLAHALPMYLSRTEYMESYSEQTVKLLQRTGLVVRQSLGFGLGIAWNVLLGTFGPSEDSQMDVLHFLALFTYLLMVLMIAFKVSAMVKNEPDTLWDHHITLLSFAMAVVCGFTLVAFLGAILKEGWLGKLEGFFISLFLAACMSALVAAANLDGAVAEPDVEANTWDYNSARLGPMGNFASILVIIPCTWCCCPWVPVLILLAGMTETLGVKEHWYQLISLVAGLASSIEGSGMLTAASDSIAQSLGFCGIKQCKHPWMFVLIQFAFAVVTTVVLIPAIAMLSGESHSPPPPPPSAPVETESKRSWCGRKKKEKRSWWRRTEKDPLLNPPPQNPNYKPSR